MGGPFTLLICEAAPLLRSRLKVCITCESRLGTTTNPFEEDEYLVLQATTKPIEMRATTATIQVNLVRMLRFISCERSSAVPGRHIPGVDTILRRELPFIYVSGMRGKSKLPPAVKNRREGCELPEGSGQYPVASGQLDLTGY
jgi:hypothetical protein